MQSIQNSTALFFLGVLLVLSGVSILGIWDLLGDDVVQKSFYTLCLVGGVSSLILVGSKYFNDPVPEGNVNLVAPNPIFHSIRVLTVTVLIVSSTLLALLGVLAIWEVMQMEMDTLYRSVATLAVIGFSSLVSIIVCLDREGIQSVTREKNLSAGTVLGTLLLFWFIWGVVSML